MRHIVESDQSAGNFIITIQVEKEKNVSYVLYYSMKKTVFTRISMFSRAF